MDELYREGLPGMFRFYSLFNDGAEFGPDKPEDHIDTTTGRQLCPVADAVHREVRDALLETHAEAWDNGLIMSWFEEGGKFEVKDEP